MNLKHIHIIEPLPLGHGPTWLGYLLDALLPCVERITVTCPDLPPYDHLAQHPGVTTKNLVVHPVKWISDKRSWPDTLQSAHAPNADLTLVTYVDMLLKKAPTDLRRQMSTPIWGIWYLPNPRRPASFWDPRRLISGRARGHYLDQAILRHVPDWLSGVLVLDERLRDRITIRSGLQVDILPDPAPTRPPLDQLDARRQLGLPPDHQIFLHFGVTNPRKGLGDAITAWTQLNDLPNALLLRAGLTLEADATGLTALIDAGHAVLHNRRIAESQINAYLRASDWVLLPYRHHEGSSGLLAEAAAADRPVIASDYGIVGARTRERGLGMVFQHLSADALADCIRRASSRRVAEYSPALHAYAAEHSIDNFCVALRRSLGLDPVNSEPTVGTNVRTKSLDQDVAASAWKQR